MILQILQDKVSITDGVYYYIDTYANFELDSGLSVPAIHVGYTGIYYDQGVKHHWITPISADPQPYPWTEGDAILSNFASMLQAKIDRLAPDPLEVAKIEKSQAINENYALAESTPITVNTKDFDATGNALAEINSVVILLLDGNTLPPAFTWLTVDGEELALDATQMKTLQLEIAKKHYQDVHRYSRLNKQVAAATTVTEVQLIPDW